MPPSHLPPLQTAPGEYNEAALRGLDYLLDEARKAGIKVRVPTCYPSLLRKKAAPASCRVLSLRAAGGPARA